MRRVLSNYFDLLFNRALIAVLTQILVAIGYIFQFVCVPFASRRRRPIAVEC